MIHANASPQRFRHIRKPPRRPAPGGESANRELERRQRKRVERHLIDAKKTRLAELLRDGLFSEASHRALSGQLDEEAAAAQAEPPG